MSPLPPAFQFVLAAVVVPAAVFDLRWRRIPNWISLAGVLLGLAMNGIAFEWAGLKNAGLGLGLALLIYFPLYLARGMGAGDVKLMAAVGAIAGPGNWLGIFLTTAVLGGVLAMLILLLRGRVGRTISNVAFLVKELAHFRLPYERREELDIGSRKAVTLPHGAVIAIGTLVFLGASRMLGV